MRALRRMFKAWMDSLDLITAALFSAALRKSWADWAMGATETLTRRETRRETLRPRSTTREAWLLWPVVDCSTSASAGKTRLTMVSRPSTRGVAWVLTRVAMAVAVVVAAAVM